MKYEFMSIHQDEFSIERMSTVLKASRSGYYRFMKGQVSHREREDKRLLESIKVIHESSRKTYGSPRVYADRTYALTA